MQRFVRAPAIVGILALPIFAPTSQAQSTAVRRAATTISRSHLDAVLGHSGTVASPIRVVSPSGEVATHVADTGVRLAPRQFVFRKMSDTARRVRIVAGAVAPGSPYQPTPAGSRSPPSAVPGKSTPLPHASPNAVIYSVPYRVLAVDAAGIEHVLVPYVIIDGGGLSYNVGTRGFRGTAFVGVEDSLNPRAGPVPLPQSLQLQLTTTRSGGTVAPRGLEIKHTGLQYDSVEIASPDSTQLRIQTSADPEGVVIPIPIRAVSVGLSPLQGRIQAFGLATTRIAVTLPRGMTRADTALIVLAGSPTGVSPETVRVTGATPALVRLRSGLPGNDTITALLDGIPVGGTSVTFSPPWSFIGALIAGLVLGGFARFFGAKRRKRVAALSWDLARGAPFGIIAAIASAVGLDLLQLKLEDPGTWIAVVLIAALGAWAGSRLLEKSVLPATSS